MIERPREEASLLFVQAGERSRDELFQLGSGAHLLSRRIVSAGSEETVQIWDATNGHTLYVLSGGDRSFYASLDGIDAVAWSPDGKQVVLGCGRDAEIWHPA